MVDVNSMDSFASIYSLCSGAIPVGEADVSSSKKSPVYQLHDRASDHHMNVTYNDIFDSASFK
jgi:hypothetical protein